MNKLFNILNGINGNVTDYHVCRGIDRYGRMVTFIRIVEPTYHEVWFDTNLKDWELKAICDAIERHM